MGQIVSVRPSIAPTPLLAAALVLRISTSEAIGAGFGWLDIVVCWSISDWCAASGENTNSRSRSVRS